MLLCACRGSDPAQPSASAPQQLPLDTASGAALLVGARRAGAQASSDAPLEASAPSQVGAIPSAQLLSTWVNHGPQPAAVVPQARASAVPTS